MEVLIDLDDIPRIPNPVLTLGVFDGVHLAHRLILERIKSHAQAVGGRSMVITFDVHPCKVVAPERYERDLFLLTTLEEKLEQFKRCGVDYVVVLPFSKKMAEMSYAHFVEEVLVKKLHPFSLWVGYNHNFGKQREGNFEKLAALGKKHGFTVDMFPEHRFEGGNVSSTEIRNHLLVGEVERANQMLGYPYALQGKLRQQEFVPLYTDKLIPAYGAYRVKLHCEEEEIPCVIHVGNEIVLADMLGEIKPEGPATIQFIERLD